MSEAQDSFSRDNKTDKNSKKNKASGKPKPVADDRDKVIGVRVKARRKLLKMTQRDLGDALGITFQQVQKYERGTNRIAAIRLADLSKVLEVPISYFYAGFGEIGEKVPNAMALSDNPQESLTDDIMVRKETLDLVRAYYKIKDPKIRQNLIKLAESMSEDQKS
jgi:transcriptional regulator with XRE-family HTH domain